MIRDSLFTAIRTLTATTVGGGRLNTVSGLAATVAGGSWISVTGDYAAVGGGKHITVTGDYATVGGGWRNTASGQAATVSGGQRNKASGDGATIGGGGGNIARGVGATVSGGGSNTASGKLATVGGGSENEASELLSTVGGGNNNKASAKKATVGGGAHNTAGGRWATVSGGRWNKASDNYATVGGGWHNTARASFATIAGGGPSDPADLTTGNRVTDNYGAVGGGGNNQAGNDDADLTNATYATVGGGADNTSSGNRATVPGGADNTAQGDYSFAAGRRAKAYGQGCFVWGDSTDDDVTCNDSDRWVARASGGVYFYTSSDLSTGLYLATGSEAWEQVSVSDRNLKENFTPVDGQEILARLAEIPITTWNYKAGAPGVRHIGPVAQDFHAAFGMGEDDKHIASLDANGVALAAVQGLYELSQEQAARIQTLEAENAALRSQMDDLEARLAALEQRPEPVEGAASANSTASAQPLQSGLLPRAGVLLAGLGLIWFNRRGGGALSLPKGLSKGGGP